MSSYLQITFKVHEENRPKAAEVYKKYRQPFLDQIKGAKTKQLLVRAEDVQVLHGFETREDAEAYLSSNLFNRDVVEALKPLMDGDPEVRVYSVA